MGVDKKSDVPSEPMIPESSKEKASTREVAVAVSDVNAAIQEITNAPDDQQLESYRELVKELAARIALLSEENTQMKDTLGTALKDLVGQEKKVRKGERLITKIGEANRALTAKNEELMSEVKRLHELSNLDGLTGIGNNRAFYTALEASVSTLLREKRPFSVIMMDMDHFKTINDTYGHPAGDQVLKEAARRLKEQVRPSDQLARYGGEEIAVVLPGANGDQACTAAKRLSNAIFDHPFVLQGQSGEYEIKVTASTGVSSFGSEDLQEDMLEGKDFFSSSRALVAKAVEDADDALYVVKRGEDEDGVDSRGGVAYRGQFVLDRRK